ncbi:restriction endonuclease [Mesorhizobium microcysteis]|uniref:Restriction endonuclease n=1 Tax=Neoaquamicrobium microcysteis TaxID=2682781 RepID=A0A5D4H5F6_9HYPH|nr:restriction endonuclease [Mesorhizobium microcysteis]TYR36056.1 restriction endonuclease [Mesorhizobium microcysteis]
MTARHRRDPEWREFERLIARIEADAGPQGLVVTSPDRLRCKLTGRMREVDATIRAKVGTTEMLVTIECRRRAKTQDVTWIEQLATKKTSIGADRTIAVSVSGFSSDAQIAASHAGISLRKVSDLTAADVNPLLGLDLVIFWHKACAITGAGIRTYRSGEEIVPEPDDADYVLPPDTDLFQPIFHDAEDSTSWSLNDVWRKVQETLNPYAEIAKGAPPIVRTARVPYPGTVTIDTPEGPRRLGYVFLGMAMWIEPEFVSIEEALKVSYAEPQGRSVHRLEFASGRTQDWRISLQAQADSEDISDVRVGGNWPHNKP